MDKYKKEFIVFMVRSRVLTFGNFLTKSGRQTPYFINTGNYQTGRQLGMLGEFYAQAMRANLGRDFNVLSGRPTRAFPLPQAPPLRCAGCIPTTFRSASTARRPRTTARAAAS